MAINVPNPGAFESQLGQHITQFRDALQALINDAEYLTAMGGATFLEAAPFSMAAADAQMVMGTVGVITPNNATVASLQAFLATTQPLWGGQ